MMKNKVVSPVEAASKIKSGDRVVLGHAASTPIDVLKAMVDNKSQYKDVEIVHMLCLGDGDYMAEEMIGHFRHNAIFVGGNSRDAVATGRADYTPCFFNEVPSLFKDGILPVDVALIQVSTPDKHGFCSYGLSCDYTKPAAEVAKIVIAEVNEKMPRVSGENFIHVSDIDYIVETSNDLYEIPLPKIGEKEKLIGENCAKLIDDGSTLQLGIGAIPDAVLLFLSDKKDLGIHTEMFSDGVIDLILKDVINGNLYEDIGVSADRVYNEIVKYDVDGISALFLSNHDSIGRIAASTSNFEDTRQAAEILLTLMGNPFIYYGDEVGMLGTRNNMVWGDYYSGLNVNYADRDIDTVSEQLLLPDSLLNTYRELGMIRNNSLALNYGDFIPYSGSNLEGYYRVFENGEDKEVVVVLFNFSSTFFIPVPPEFTSYEIMYATHDSNIGGLSPTSTIIIKLPWDLYTTLID